MKSKKIIAMAVLAVMCCSILFAAEAKKNEKRAKSADNLVLTFTPGLGLSATSATSGFGNISITQFDLGFHAAMLGIPKVAKDSYLNNLTPMVNIDLGIAGKPSIGGESNKNTKTSAVLFQMSVLCGYTFKPITNLYLTPAVGLGFAAGSVKTSSTVIINEYTGEKYTEEDTFKTGAFSLPFFFGLKYFFTDLIGIELTLIDSLNFGTVLTTPFGNFQNTFVLKVGPIFRFDMKI
ncbi:DUF2715 domain-containing protein [Treponema pedis]|uniref:DUF2715 domain-containing protein n=1 Tax=Treponema pedis TaxID=409322 RepID=UPI003D19695F